MADPDYVLRLRRAQERIKFLDERVERWRQGHANPLYVEFDHATLEHVFRTREMGPLPDRLGLDIGECLFYLRSGLDYVAHRLGDLKCGPIDKTNAKELRQPEFPIFGDRAPRPDEWTKKIGRAHPDAIQIIEDLQPYRGQDYAIHPLWVLNELHNVDKHRMIAPVAMSAQVQTVEPINATILRARWQLRGPVINGREVYRTRYEPIDPTLPAHVNINFLIYVGFDDTPVVAYEPVTGWLEAIQEFIQRDVVAKLAPYL